MYSFEMIMITLYVYEIYGLKAKLSTAPDLGLNLLQWLSADENNLVHEESI